jgi:hypothetical protein
VGRNEMAGLKGKSGPPGKMNAFKRGLADMDFSLAPSSKISNQVVDHFMLSRSSTNARSKASTRISPRRGYSMSRMT